MRFVNGILLSLLFLIVPSAAWAQSLDDHGDPASPDSAMYTLDDIYNRLDPGVDRGHGAHGRSARFAGKQLPHGNIERGGYLQQLLDGDRAFLTLVSTASQCGKSIPATSHAFVAGRCG